MDLSVSDLLCKLIELPSPSGNEQPVCDFLFQYLTSAGLPVEKQPVDAGGYNLIVKVGRPRLYLSSHLDVVNPPVPLHQVKDQIIGRGACDAKGSVAAMVAATIKAFQQGISDFGLVLTVGEETDFRGINKLLSSRFHPEFVIVGEPTGLQAVTGHFGYLELLITAAGRTAHTSQPQLGDNAIEKLLTAISAFKSVPIHPDTPATLVKISGGVAANVVPDLASALYNFRISPADAADYPALFAAASPQVTVSPSLTISAVKTQLPSQLNFLVDAGVTKYTTELSAYGRGLVLGPGQIQHAHTPKEYITLSQLHHAVDLYLRSLASF